MVLSKAFCFDLEKTFGREGVVGVATVGVPVILLVGVEAFEAKLTLVECNIDEIGLIPLVFAARAVVLKRFNEGLTDEVTAAAAIGLVNGLNKNGAAGTAEEVVEVAFKGERVFTPIS